MSTYTHTVTLTNATDETLTLDNPTEAEDRRDGSIRPPLSIESGDQATWTGPVQYARNDKDYRTHRLPSEDLASILIRQSMQLRVTTASPITRTRVVRSNWVTAQDNPSRRANPDGI